LQSGKCRRAFCFTRQKLAKEDTKVAYNAPPPPPRPPPCPPPIKEKKYDIIC